jgi:hypothetical protein
MKTTKEELNQTIYIVDERTGEVEEDVFKTIIEYFKDKTTTPKGVAPRLHIRENVDDETYDLWTWGVRGNNPKFIESYDTEEEAEMALWECWIDNFDKDNGGGLNDAPNFFFNKDDAEERANEIKNEIK